MKGIYFIFSLLSVGSASASEHNWQLILESGALYQSRSDVQIPPNSGTRFSLVEAIGHGPILYGRIEAKYALNAKHHLRLLIAPLAIEKHGQLDKTVIYDGNTFAANTDTLYRYQFNSYRLSYAYRFIENQNWSLDAGLTAKIRDAEIALTQGSTKSSYTNVGFVPLIYLAAEKRLTQQWAFQTDLDAAWSPYGRAFDLGLFAHYHFNKNWSLGAGYRTLEGGADVDKVYNFAWFHYAGLRLAFRN